MKQRPVQLYFMNKHWDFQCISLSISKKLFQYWLYEGAPIFRRSVRKLFTVIVKNKYLVISILFPTATQHNGIKNIVTKGVNRLKYCVYWCPFEHSMSCHICLSINWTKIVGTFCLGLGPGQSMIEESLHVHILYIISKQFVKSNCSECAYIFSCWNELII